MISAHGTEKEFSMQIDILPLVNPWKSILHLNWALESQGSQKCHILRILRQNV